MALPVLILDGNVQAINSANVAAGGKPTGESYAAVLRSLDPDVKCTILAAADPGGGQLPAGVSLDQFAGAAITGSALNFHRGGPAIDQQVELAKAMFAAEVPVFGSCWGLQLMAAALGGTVRANPKGRELFIARSIWRTGAGKAHPMFKGKPLAFDAPAVHSDEVSVVPDGGVVLAANQMSDIQALSIVRGRSHFWGVQYHPEFSLHDLAVIVRRYGQRLVDEGLFKTLEELQLFASSASALSRDDADMADAFAMGVSETIMSPAIRLAELRNWLRDVVIGGYGLN